MTTPLNSFISQLVASLDPVTRQAFGPMEQFSLEKSLTRCGMTCYPPAPEHEVFDRADGLVFCNTCGQEYAQHPMDWRVIGYGNVPFLNVLCDGRRVKL